MLGIRRLISVVTFVLAGLMVSAQKTDPHLPVVVKITATWCNVCGLDAWDSFHDLVDQYDDQVAIMAVHADKGSALYSEAAAAYADNLPDRFGQPQLYVNDQTEGVLNDWRWNGLVQKSLNELRPSTPRAATAIEYTIEDGQILVNATTTFLRETNREHHLAIYLLEDHVAAFQNNRRPDELHRKVLRTHLSDDPMGDLIATETIEAGQVFESSYSLTLSEDWNTDELDLVAIIFEKVHDRYTFVNGSFKNKASTSTALSANTLETASLRIAPMPLTGSSVAIVHTVEKLDQVQLAFYDMQGRHLQTVFSGDLGVGEQKFDLRDFLPPAGYHLVGISSRQGRLFQKILVQH